MNLIIIVLLILAAVAVIYFVFFRKAPTQEEDNYLGEDYSIAHLAKAVEDKIDSILRTNYAELNLNRVETEKSERSKKDLRKALGLCRHGNLGCKLYVKDYIKDLLQRAFNVNQENINRWIPFDDPSSLTAQQKFEILMYIYKKMYNLHALVELINRNNLNKAIYDEDAKDIHYEIDRKAIEYTYRRHKTIIEGLDFVDKLNILTQEVYQRYKGLDCIDEIRDMVIDGINCGTSGIPDTFYQYGVDATFGAPDGDLPLASYNAVWLMLGGRKIHLSCIGFESQKRLERVAKIICRYNNPGALSENRPYIVNELQDGCRVVVARPGMSEGWVFFVRKFDVANRMSIKELYPYEGNDKLDRFIYYLTKGCRNFALTGQQATGKTTCLMALIGYTRLSWSIRVQEMAFELNLRKIYPKRNIVTFRETASTPAQEGIDLQKKTDGDIALVGEVAQAKVASLAIQNGKTGSGQLIFTHHAKTTRSLVTALRDNMIEAGGFNNEKIVEETVAEVLNFDIHLNRSVDGKRYIERITEIIPRKIGNYPTKLRDAIIEFFYRMTDRRLFETRDVLVYDNGVYRFVNPITEEQQVEIKKFLTLEEIKTFEEFCSKVSSEVFVNGSSGGGIEGNRETVMEKQGIEKLSETTSEVMQKCSGLAAGIDVTHKDARTVKATERGVAVLSLSGTNGEAETENVATEAIVTESKEPVTGTDSSLKFVVV